MATEEEEYYDTDEYMDRFYGINDVFERRVSPRGVVGESHEMTDGMLPREPL
eukprot:CAMPEP_0194059240 /NCGR_PEP_ID=MMETSP0009_2-20130614/68468_1 /TAXON_ID=210454 /ORGANISM="Grammatophora oceanica, Strain CCMP 410" /LENGTH=51 /DNA_ID=CAMNT_0038709695 /DNA_START=57 /DNA_END=208 /DNA_ORIENTATION=-